MSEGTYRKYIGRRFTASRLEAIDRANKIIAEYEGRGISITLRQLYYQHVARGFIENSETSYDRLGSLINDGRLAGLISWTSIEDRTRFLAGLETHLNPGHAISAAARSYRRDLWKGQPCRPEVWVEKEAVIAGICNELRVDYFVTHGYNSQSEQWRAGRRLAHYIQQGQRPVIFHISDHDPSGLDMTSDNTERLSMFAGTQIQVIRLALNRDQIDKYNPPPNPAKQTDSRFAAYARQHGDESWELDALDPAVVSSLIEDAVLRLRDHDRWDAALSAEVADRVVLDGLAREFGGGTSDADRTAD